MKRKSQGARLTVEVNVNFVEAGTAFPIPGGGTFIVTPPLDGDYFIARVVLHKDQAVQIFPKFMTIGCGFAIEEGSWNTNLPLAWNTDELVDHIWKNRKYEEITKEMVAEAVDLLKAWRRGVDPDFAGQEARMRE